MLLDLRPGSPDRMKLLNLCVDIAAFRYKLALRRWAWMVLQASYNPDQPRVPAGSPDGGQLTSGENGDGSPASDASGPSQNPDETFAPTGYPNSDQSMPVVIGTDGPPTVQNVVFKSWPAPPNLKALGVDTLDLPVGNPLEGMVHILAGHSAIGPASTGKSIYDPVVIAVFDSFLQAALPYGTTQIQGSLIAVEVHAIVPVGTDAGGNSTYDFRTIIAKDLTLGSGGYKVITSYPIPNGTAGKFLR